jgi:hypothetical protein
VDTDDFRRITAPAGLIAVEIVSAMTSARHAPGKPTKPFWRHAYQCTEATRKVAVIGEAADQSDLGQ